MHEITVTLQLSDSTAKLVEQFCAAVSRMETQSCNTPNVEAQVHTEVVGKDDPSPAPKHKPDRNPEEPAVEEPTMSLDELRTRISTLADKYDTLDVASIMAGMGYEKLSAIPKGRYGELLRLVDEAVREVG
jgi:hypothetical protein